MNDNSTPNPIRHIQYLKSILKMSKKEAAGHYLDVCQGNSQEYEEATGGYPHFHFKRANAFYGGWLLEFEGKYSDLDKEEIEYIHSFDKFRKHLLTKIERYTNE